MAILQALISFITRSAGKILNAIFGWAVLALFGRTTQREQTLLSAVVAAAAAWPLLLLGIAVPKVTLFVVSFVPLSKSVPSAWLRIVGQRKSFSGLARFLSRRRRTSHRRFRMTISS